MSTQTIKMNLTQTLGLLRKIRAELDDENPTPDRRKVLLAQEAELREQSGGVVRRKINPEFLKNRGEN